ncbi:pectin lyase fold/virulence factor [Aspergillus nidulans var. acristatus]
MDIDYQGMLGTDGAIWSPDIKELPHLSEHTRAPATDRSQELHCTCTEYSQIPSAVASCTSIVLSDIAAPNGPAIDLSNLQTRTTVTFDGLPTFGFTNSSSFKPVTIGGKDTAITATEGAVVDGNGQAYWDGLDMVVNNTAGNEPNARSSGLAAAHNSDGFDVSSSYNIIIRRNSIYNQDDCVAITSRNNMTVSEMLCSEGHGLSIGSVGGKSNNVTNILFTNSVVSDSQNGARIKTNYNTTGFVSNVTYSNIADYLNGGPTGIPSSGSMALSGQDNYILCGTDSCPNLAFEDVSITGAGVPSSCNYNVTGCS